LLQFGATNLPQEKVLVVGLGDVGSALFELLEESVKFAIYGFDSMRARRTKNDVWVKFHLQIMWYVSDLLITLFKDNARSLQNS